MGQFDFSYSPPPRGPNDSIASERLRRAIERNRRKRGVRPVPGPKPPGRGQRIFVQALKKLCWVFLLAMSLRLIFSERGAIDYFAMKKLVGQKARGLAQLKGESEALRAEIKKLKTDGAYQKKIVRDKLGLIENKEFLIIFSEDSP